MAKNHLTSFGPEDVLIVLRCGKCQGELSFSAGNKPKVLNHCPVCLEEWDRSDQDHGRIAQLQNLSGLLFSFGPKTNPEGGEKVEELWTMRLIIEGLPNS